MSSNAQKVLLGMSGGVDSSVSALLLLEQGYDVIGAFMKNWSGDVHGPEDKDPHRVGSAYEECGWKQERRDAARVAAALGIPFITFDFEQEYRRNVVEYLFTEYEAGRTPNPDVMCNRYIKFDRFVQAADELECPLIATGHYARIQPTTQNEITEWKLQMALDTNKDQTYFLWAIDPSVLSRVLFPIGHLTKPQVREKAKAVGLDVAEKKDSTGICFVGEVEMMKFLQTRIPTTPGDVLTSEGKKIGTHQGVHFYTIGQRHGLGIGGGDPYYVVEKHLETNELVVASNYHDALYRQQLTATHVRLFVPEQQLLSPNAYHSRIRHRQPLQDCCAVLKDGILHVQFKQPQRAVTPGQSIVLYRENLVIGGGVIE